MQPAAWRELHLRLAPQLYSLAGRLRMDQRERRVQDALLQIGARAACHAGSSLDARTWALAVAQRCWVSQTNATQSNAAQPNTAAGSAAS